MKIPQDPDRQVYPTDGAETTERTLRLIASLPAPEGLTDRVHRSLRTAPTGAPVLAWRTGMTLRGWSQTQALRGAAAAAIVCLVVGGGWRVYSHVQAEPAAHLLVAPPRVGPPGGFSSAGAMRVPDAQNRPILLHEVPPAFSAAEAVPAVAQPKGKSRVKRLKPMRPAPATPVR